MADIITRLKLESGEYDSKIKRATQGLLQMEQECRKAGKSMNDISKNNMEYVRSLGQMETVSNTARGKLNELSSAFTEFSVIYKRLTDEEKKSDFGKALNSSLSQLKTRINESKQQLADVSKELGETGVNMGKLGAEGLDLKSAMSTLGGQLGINTSLITGLSAGTMGAVAAIGALIAAEVKAAQAFAEYNEEIGKQSQVTTVTTGLSGGDAERMTTAARSLAKVYNTDFREVINAANTLMTQFGKSGDEAIELIRDGMQGMIMGDGGKLLSMIQQYAPSFRDAGIEASQLVAIIQNSEGGIFTDQNMNAIVMGIRNIRLMTKQTSEALAQLGIDGQKMSKQLNDGSLTIFDALQQVAGAIESVDSNSQAAGEVMQSVFGRQGTMAGTNLGKAIATLNTNLEETKRQTGGVGQATAELEQATERLDKAIRNCFGYDGWLEMSNGIKTDLTNAMADFLDVLNKVDHVMVSISGKGVFENMIDTIIKALGPLGTLAVKLNDIFNLTDKLGLRFGDEGTSTPSTSKLPNLSKAGAWGTTLNRFTPQTSTMADRPAPVTPSATPSITPIKTNTNTNKTPRIETAETDTKELTIQQQISALEKEALTASEQRREEIRATIRELDRELARQKEIVSSLHEVPSDAVDKAVTALQTAQDEAAKYVKEKQVKVDTSTLQSVLRDSLQEGIDTATLNLDSVAEQIAQGIDVPDEVWQEILDEYNALREAIGENPICINFETGEAKESKEKELKKDGDDLAKSWTSASKAIGSIGSALQAIEDPTAKVAGLVAQAIAQIAATFAASLKGTFTPWDWIAGAAAGTATMISTIAAIKSATKGGFAEGGIVPGNSFSGDNLRISDYGINSGELILSRAQQDTIASALEQSDENAIGGTPYVLGETIYIGLTNYLRRTGRGELITANR